MYRFLLLRARQHGNEATNAQARCCLFAAFCLCTVSNRSWQSHGKESFLKREKSGSILVQQKAASGHYLLSHILGSGEDG